MIWIAYAMAWLSTSAAAIAGMYFTHSAWCLWVFTMPACIEIKNRWHGDEKKKKAGRKAGKKVG